MSGVEGGGWRYVYYKTLSGHVPVREFIDSQTPKVRERIFSALERLVRFNVELSPPYVEKVTGRDFWELRTRIKGNIYRIFYIAYTGKKFVLLHGFQKKSQKTPGKELQAAEDRMRDYLERKERR